MKLIKNIDEWSINQNIIYNDIYYLLKNDNEKNKPIIITYLSHIINIVDSTDNKYQHLIFNQFLNRNINLSFISSQLYYYLNILNLNTTTLISYIKDLNKQLNFIKT
jgi:hypothetical protein